MLKYLSNIEKHEYEYEKEQESVCMSLVVSVVLFHVSCSSAIVFFPISPKSPPFPVDHHHHIFLLIFCFTPSAFVEIRQVLQLIQLLLQKQRRKNGQHWKRGSFFHSSRQPTLPFHYSLTLKDFPFDQKFCTFVAIGVFELNPSVAMDALSTDCQDWDLLQNSNLNHNTTGGFDGVEEGEIDDDGICPDYFALESKKRDLRARVYEKDERLEGLVSDNTSWIDPESCSWYSRGKRGELGLKGLGFRNREGLWSSDESEDDQKSQVGRDSELDFAVASSEIEIDYSGIRCHPESDEEHMAGETEEIDRTKERSYSSDGFEFDGSSEGRDQGECLNNGSLEHGCPKDEVDSKGKKLGMAWLKLPLEVLKLYLFKVRPVWSISIAVAVMGFIIVGRRLYKLKRKAINGSIKMSIDDKKTASFMVHAARLNEVLSAVRRIPIAKTTMPPPGMSLFPAMAWR